MGACFGGPSGRGGVDEILGQILVAVLQAIFEDFAEGLLRLTLHGLAAGINAVWNRRRRGV
jgi:hypothetical protein